MFLESLYPYQRDKTMKDNPIIVCRGEKDVHIYPNYREVLKLWSTIKPYQRGE